jgi:hypothetical protein
VAVAQKGRKRKSKTETSERKQTRAKEADEEVKKVKKGPLTLWRFESSESGRKKGAQFFWWQCEGILIFRNHSCCEIRNSRDDVGGFNKVKVRLEERKVG